MVFFLSPWVNNGRGFSLNPLWANIFVSMLFTMRSDSYKNNKNIFLFQLPTHEFAAEATSLDWKSQCLANPSVPLLRLADKKSRIYRV
jgi:hypothetical protein